MIEQDKLDFLQQIVDHAIDGYGEYGEYIQSLMAAYICPRMKQSFPYYAKLEKELLRQYGYCKEYATIVDKKIVKEYTETQVIWEDALEKNV